jgi:hypothetical protein
MHNRDINSMCPYTISIPNHCSVPGSLNPLKIEFIHSFIYKSSSYLTGNTLRLHYKAQPGNSIRETVAVHCENHTEHTDTLCG